MKYTLAIILAALVPVLAKSPADRPALIIYPELMDEVYTHMHLGTMRDAPQDIFAFCPTEEMWKDMCPWVLSRSNVKEKSYIKEAWDCEDMAREWVHWTHRWAVEKFTKGDPYPIATYMVDAKIYDGFMGFKLDEPMFHALGLIRMSTGVWWLFDPQTQQRVRLAQALYGEGNIEIRKVIW